MRRTVGLVVLALSGAGFPLTQMVITRFGRRGAVVVEVVTAGLLIRDAVLVGSGTPARLRRSPAVLLNLELATAAAATAAGVRPIATGTIHLRTGRAPADGIEVARRAAVGALFGVHTLRWWIYLSPDRGLRQPASRLVPRQTERVAAIGSFDECVASPPVDAAGRAVPIQRGIAPRSCGGAW